MTRPERPNWLWDKDISLMFEDERELAQKYIEYLETESDARMDSIRELRDNRAELGIKIMELEEQQRGGPP